MISVAHSPDNDDYFLFWAIAKDRIDCEGLSFSFEQFDTEKLNRFAREGRYDVTAVSVGAYPQIAEKYLILPHGASVGRTYGPVIAAKKKLSVDELSDCTVGIPGESTTAALVFKQLAPNAKTAVLAIEPYGAMFDALERGEVDALLLIHEGQLTYKERGLVRSVDIGEWWHERTQLPLPLGINVIKRELGPEKIERVSCVLRNAVRYALDHREEVLQDLLAMNQDRAQELTDTETISNYLSMYANEDSYQLPEECKRAIDVLLAGKTSSIDYAP